jgi:hypothetical protein
LEKDPYYAPSSSIANKSVSCMSLGDSRKPEIYQPGNNIEDGELILDEYNCAVQKKVLLQGRLFISNEALYFYSMFNNSTIFFGQETKIKINYSEIGDIKKAKNAKIFHNSILIKLKVGIELFLTSFLSRDECFRLILK